MGCNLFFFSVFILTASSFPPSILSRHTNYPAEGLPKSNITLKSFDGIRFEVKDSLKSISETIKQPIEENGIEDAVSLPEVDGLTLSKVIEYCNYHLAADQEDNSPNSEDLEQFDSEFVRIEYETLFDLFRAANYLKIESLHHLIGQTIGKMMRGKTPAQIRLLFPACKPDASPL